MTIEELNALEQLYLERSDSLDASSYDIPMLIAMARECLKLRNENAMLLDLCNQINGFVKSYGLSDEGPDSEWDRWKDCVDTLHSLLRKDAPRKPERELMDEVIARWTVNRDVDMI